MKKILQTLTNNRTLKITFLCCLIHCLSYAQTHTHKANISAVKQDGLYRIAITPVIRCLSTIDLGDIRIMDSKQREVPYVIYRQNATPSTSTFWEYPYIKETKIKRNTTLIITNTDKQQLDKLSLVIKNTAVEKKYLVNGSDNGRDWFAVTQNQTLLPLTTNTDNSVQTIYFPAINYRYLQLVIADSSSAPINIVKVGNFKNALPNEDVVAIKAYNISINNTANKTIITLQFDCPQVIDKIGFRITAPTYFKRHAKLLVQRERIIKKKKEISNDAFFDFELNANYKNDYNIPSLQTQKLIIEIDNQNNPPLTIVNVDLKQNITYLVANLKANNDYSIFMGNTELDSPNYDLKYFVNKLPVQELLISEPTSILVQETITAKAFWQHRYFMWACIVMGALVVIYFSYNLLKDIKKS